MPKKKLKSYDPRFVKLALDWFRSELTSGEMVRTLDEGDVAPPYARMATALRREVARGKVKLTKAGWRRKR